MAIAGRNRRWLLLALAFFGALVLGLIASFGWERAVGRSQVMRGVSCAGVPISGLSRTAVKSALEQHSNRVASSTTILELRETSKTWRLGELGVALDVDETAKRALALGRNQGLLREATFWFARLFSTRELEPKLLVDEKKVESVLKPWTTELLKAPRLPSISFHDELRVEPGSAGEVVDFEALSSRLHSAAVQVLSLEKADQTVRPISVPSKHRSPVVDPERVAQARTRAEMLLSGPIFVHVQTEDEDRKLRLGPSTLGAALGSQVDEANSKFELTLSVAQLRPVMRELLSQVERPAKDATFDFSARGHSKIVESQAGRALDEDAFKKAIWVASSSKERRVELPLRSVAPKLTTEQAQSLGIKGLVSQFVTHHACCQPRVHNIHTAAARLDGTMLRPGERFSLNDLLGPRSRAAGYESAPTIVRGEMRSVYGGGISQLATTLFNAVLRGGYKIIQRQPHSVYFSRYPEGHEATVSFPLPDLIFENDTKAGMLIKTQYTGTFIKVLIYGDNEGRQISVSKSKRYDIVKPPVEYEASEQMDPERPKRLRAGQLGWTVLVSRKIRYSDGHVDEQKREVVYNARPELRRVHPCTIPEGEDGHTGEDCPEPEALEEVISDDVFYETVNYDEEEG